MSWFGRIKKQAILSPRPVSAVFGLDRGTPIDRAYIEQFLGKYAADVRGDVLEVGGTDYGKKFGAADARLKAFVYNASENDLPSTEKVTGDLTKHDGLPPGVADCFICTQTFNFIFDLQAALEGARHLLRPGGVLLATVACLAPVSAYDAERWGDFWRLTPQGCERLFSAVFGKNVTIEPFGNSAAAALFMKGYAVEDLPGSFDLLSNDPLFPVIVGIRAAR